MMKLPDLPYFKIFNERERIASKACADYVCNVCHKVTFYSDVMNLEDHPELVNLVAVVCVKCRKKYNASFQKKRKKYFDKNSESTNKKKL